MSLIPQSSVSSVEYSSIRIYTVWSSDCLRTLEFTDLSLSLSFEQFGSPPPFTSDVVDNVLVIDRETLATVIDLLEHPLGGARSGPHSCPNRTDQNTLSDREQVPNTSAFGTRRGQSSGDPSM
ncbi:hypothetical protein SAMN05192552_10615 [Natrinema hispanicum]|uniref:Uncharacterized protein n=1 Tax=Natrinema hispanicum TaxID=392421 RepID=A0A1G6Y8B7_9EURY|nr:hypothetical protein SAMN05192552_10615 [Natrinema hispanicum]SEU09634.1 hypothetical protein SAMN04488694_1439 [Natrinema hispanicum]